jgi:hypothetical protein
MWRRQNCQFQHAWNVFGPNGQFLHVWNVSWSKPSVSARLEYVMVKAVRLSMTGMCQGKDS